VTVANDISVDVDQWAAQFDDLFAGVWAGSEELSRARSHTWAMGYPRAQTTDATPEKTTRTFLSR
jgi:hypothetical protein